MRIVDIITRVLYNSVHELVYKPFHLYNLIQITKKERLKHGGKK